ncbi:hypothetical protein PGT21_035708 [Puccinia graminis f. sp. tritici]|uniref:Uncharacterized protein n=1 Tax=Puccinia graminis f. sp. tritici TaxID=56615 RepID=A0A5B0RXM2_PUCGR|nr:hypothetical protein PGT21_035708 [Puccinia graminis f. sp. tritici]KAA1130172.1 hypothetical protein PGTUg99_012745 [Puccinia graminis f. sp. tritici]
MQRYRLWGLCCGLKPSQLSSTGGPFTLQALISILNYNEEETKADVCQLSATSRFNLAINLCQSLKACIYSNSYRYPQDLHREAGASNDPRQEEVRIDFVHQRPPAYPLLTAAQAFNIEPRMSAAGRVCIHITASLTIQPAGRPSLALNALFPNRQC